MFFHPQSSLNYVQNAEIDATNEDAPQVVKTYLWDPSEPVAARILHMTVWNNGTEVESLYYTHDLQKINMKTRQ